MISFAKIAGIGILFYMFLSFFVILEQAIMDTNTHP